MLVSWNTTNSCNLNCKHCYRNAGKQLDQELTTIEGMKLIDQIAAAGFKILIFSGGEPLVRDDIFDLIKHAADRGLRPVIGTNGTLLDSKMVKRLIDCKTAVLGISLDSITQQKHDCFRGVMGAWQKTVTGMKLCREAGLPFQIHTTITDWNADEIEKLTDYAVEAGAKAHHLFFLIPTGRGINIENRSLQVNQYEKTLEQIIEKQKKVNIEIKPTCAPQFMRITKQKNIASRFTRGCLAGITYCVINPVGNVQPCAYLDTAVGNVRESPFDEIWREAPMLKMLRSLEYNGKCGTCNYKQVCGGCRARANYYHKDFMDEDPLCRYSCVANRMES